MGDIVERKMDPCESKVITREMYLNFFKVKRD